jgi:hypothetical protein
MKTIDELNISEYRFFFLTEETEPFDIKAFTSLGYQNIPKERYDLIETSAGILIGFKTDLFGFQNYMYETAQGRKYIQLVVYQLMKDVIDGVKVGNFDFYSFFDSVYIKPEKLYETSEEELKDVDGNVFKRCDVDKYGAKVFYPVYNNYNIINVRLVIDIAGIGHVTYFNTTNEGNVNMTSRTKNTAARTFTGIIKTLLEWSQVAEDPFYNSEAPAVKAKQMLDELKIPADLLEWVDNNQIDMAVARYLKGETDISAVHEENPEMPEVAKKYLKTNCIYKNIASLYNNHPRGYLMGQEIIEKEKQYLESQIYSLYLNGLISSTNQYELEEYINSLEESLVSINDIKSLYFDHKQI